jgi:hypothetical protein
LNFANVVPGATVGRTVGWADASGQNTKLATKTNAPNRTGQEKCFGFSSFLYLAVGILWGFESMRSEALQTPLGKLIKLVQELAICRTLRTNHAIPRLYNGNCPTVPDIAIPPPQGRTLLLVLHMHDLAVHQNPEPHRFGLDPIELHGGISKLDFWKVVQSPATMHSQTILQR